LETTTSVTSPSRQGQQALLDIARGRRNFDWLWPNPLTIEVQQQFYDLGHLLPS
jgi:hypothetical protein